MNLRPIHAFSTFEISVLHGISQNGRASLLPLFSTFDQTDADEDEEAKSLKLRFEEQQKQIDTLIKLVQQQQSQRQNQPVGKTLAEGPANPQPTTTTPPPLVLAPCKVMLFIDGTWLYYSLHERGERDCPIIQKYGRDWQNRYAVDWDALPRILCENLQDPGWTTTSTAMQQQQRPIEVVRASVFTSYKADTSPLSIRYQMFQEMKTANYDVHMMETVGRGEKCVDIQLAVEMLHYATVPHAYDIALLLTGDKDFMPAMIRTRQKGRKVGLASMKRGCNRALFETPGVKDFDVIWLEDTLDQWIVPKENAPARDQSSSMYSADFFVRIIYDYCHQSGFEQVSSRDLGRYLKFLRLPQVDAISPSTCVLDELKRAYGGLSFFLNRHDDVFVMNQRRGGSYKEDATDKAYWVSLRDTVSPSSLPEPVDPLTDHEQAFLRRYSTDILHQQRSTAYYHTLLVLHGKGNPQQHVRFTKPQKTTPLVDELTRDYSKCTVKELKERCRERGLSVSGLKKDLIDRVEKDVEEQIRRRNQTEDEDEDSLPPIPMASRPFGSSTAPEGTDYLRDLVVEYVKASGGSANSRDVGRYLAANKASTATNGTGAQGKRTALQELKMGFGNLGNFVLNHSEILVKRDEPIEGESVSAFLIDLR